MAGLAWDRVHYASYALLYAVPLLGMANRLWSPDAWNFLGMPLPHVPVTGKPLSKQLESIHETLGQVLMYPAAAHAAIALAQHVMLRESTLRSMFPFWRRANGTHADSAMRALPKET